MDAGDEIREEMGYGGALAALAIAELNRRRQGSKVKPETAFLFRSLKHPKEVETRRSVYGSSLIVISVFEPETARQQRLALRIEQSRQALLERGVPPTWSTGDDC